MITISIDLTKIDKTRIVDGKNGQKYYNLTVDNLKVADKFGNTHTVYQSQTKDERTAKTDKVYLGNGKEWIFEEKKADGLPTPQKVESGIGERPNVDSGLPF